MAFIDKILTKGLVPDFIIRYGIRRLLRQRLDEEGASEFFKAYDRHLDHVKQMSEGPIAICTDEANDQHYEVQSDFYELVLGPYLKYSCGYWDQSTSDLGSAEKKMLDVYIERADIQNGQKILDLGCGWGSVSLYLSEKFSGSQVTGVSNSSSQKKFIDEQARERGITNLEIITCNINDLHFDKKFDRIISIEMFEHMRNYQKLLQNINSWLEDDGLLFVHIFTHRFLTYFFQAKDESDWMGRYFFTEGVMPSDSIFYHFNDHMLLKNQWKVSGTHYQKTARAWLDNMDQNREKIQKIFNHHYQKDGPKKWWNYWRIFFMSCEELWGFSGGDEWFVSHYLFEKR